MKKDKQITGLQNDQLPTKHRFALIALSLGSFGLGTSEFSSMGILQLFASDLSVDIPKATNAITAYALGVVIGAPLVTLAAARLNRRFVLLLLMVLFIVGNLVSAIAPSLGFLVVGRFISGMPQGVYFGAGAVVATYIMGKAGGGKAFALIIFGLTISTIIGAPIGTYIGQQLGWRIAYAAYAAYGLIALAAMIRWLPKTPQLDGNPIRQELAALRKWNVWGMMLVSALAIASIFAIYTFIGPLITDVAHLSPSIIPIAQVLYGIGMAGGTIVGGRLADRYEFKGMIIGFSATLCVLFIMAFFAANSIILLGTLSAVGFTMSLAIPTIPVRMTHMAPEAPTLMGAMNMAAFNAANAIGAAAGGFSIAAGFGLLSVVWTGFALTAIGLIIFGLLYSRLSTK